MIVPTEFPGGWAVPTPDKIMIVRHGEKPTDENDKPYGVEADGERGFESLSPRGRRRAAGTRPSPPTTAQRIKR